jgi:hypothetical protein
LLGECVDRQKHHKKTASQGNFILSSLQEGRDATSVSLIGTIIYRGLTELCISPYKGSHPSDQWIFWGNIDNGRLASVHCLLTNSRFDGNVCFKRSA